MAWFWAESAAEDLIARMDSPAPLNTFGFQATRTVLSLTMLFTGIASRADELSLGQLELMRDLVCTSGAWMNWCDSRLDQGDAPAPSLCLARRAWRWLLTASPPSSWLLPRNRSTGCRIGLIHAQMAVDTQLSHPRELGSRTRPGGVNRRGRPNSCQRTLSLARFDGTVRQSGATPHLRCACADEPQALACGGFAPKRAHATGPSPSTSLVLIDADLAAVPGDQCAAEDRLHLAWVKAVATVDPSHREPGRARPCPQDSP